MSFGSLMDIDKLIPVYSYFEGIMGFGSLMDIDKLILKLERVISRLVLVL